MVSFWSARRLSILLTIIALALWSYSIAQAKLNIGFYGLIHSFPVTFFLALALLTIASAILWGSRENHGKLLCLQLCFLITALWLSPILVGSNAEFANHAYIYFGHVQYIDQQGHLNAAYFMYHNWPAQSILWATSTQVVGVANPDPVATLGTFLMQFLVLLPLYILLRNTIGKSNYCWAAIWIFYLGNWAGQLYFMPPGMGFFLLLTLLAVLTKALLSKRTMAVSDWLMSILIMACLTITHLLTAIAGCLSIIALLLAARRYKIAALAIIGGALIAVWTIYGSPAQLQINLHGLIDRLFRVDLLFKQQITDVLAAPNPSYSAVNHVKLWAYVLFIAIGIAGFIFSRKSRNKADRTILFLIAVPIIMVFMNLYGEGLIARIYLLALMPIAYFGVKLLNFKAASVILCLLLLIALPVHMIAQYGTAAINDIPKGEIACWHFIDDKTTEGYFAMPDTGVYPYTLLRTQVPLGELSWVNDRLVGTVLKDKRPLYVDIGEQSERMYDFMYNNPAFIPETRSRLENSPYFNLIYVNPDLSLYMSEAQ
ncbi:MAG: hypothetical protein ABSF21_01595 [Dehalococcoidia bacterium]|jgi:hypothetical protein